MSNSFGEEVGVDVLWTFLIVGQVLQHLQERAAEDMPCHFDASHQAAQVWPSRGKGVAQELRIAQRNMLAALAESSRPFGLELP